MGMHVGFVAVRADVDASRDAFGSAWPMQEVVASAKLAGVAALAGWHQANARLVSAHHWTPDNRGTRVVAFWQDGPWAVVGHPGRVFDERRGVRAGRSS